MAGAAKALGKGWEHTQRVETRTFQLLYFQVLGDRFLLLDRRAGPDDIQMSLPT